jgi:PAS domain S-box-containing protein
VVQDISERKKAEAELRRTSDLLKAVADATPDAVFVKDAEGRYQLVNPAAARFVGRAVADMLGRDDSELFNAADAQLLKERDRRVMRTGMMETEEEVLTLAGVTRTFLATKAPYRDGNGKIAGTIGISRDVTEQRRLEEQYRQSQKMDAIGNLAGGIAHDFNNLLTIINGYSYLLLQSAPADGLMRERLEEIKKAGERSAALTRQLLAFSRRQLLMPVVLDLNEVVRDTEKMLRRVIGEDIELVTSLHPQLERIKADPGQLEQVLLNLAVNARDAMPQGGKLHIETSNVVLDEGYAKRHPRVRPGMYVVLKVRDTGVGMTEEVKRHIFEPFFTTKEPGKGTGLGLSVVHGIVEQSEGHFEVESAPGAGACFSIFLPRSEPSGQSLRLSAPTLPAPRGGETILLVEDESTVRQLSVAVLKECGYTVLEAGSGDEALTLRERHAGPIHLLVTDVVMPGMSGRVLAEKLCAELPELKVLYISGYTDDAVVRYGVAHELVAFLRKPYTPISFAHKIREVLDATQALRA